MKTVVLLRHAKSSWRDSSLMDHDRPLKGRGRRAAAAMGEFLGRQGVDIDLVLCSSAKRATQTLDLLFGEPPETEITRDLYMAGPDELMARLRGLREPLATVLLIAHNPGIQMFAGLLAGSGAGPDLARMERKYPTCALAVLTFDLASWPDIGPGGGVLGSFTVPKDLA